MGKNIMKFFILLTVFVFGMAPFIALGNTGVLNSYSADMKPVGDGRLTYMFWDVYDATLYAPKGEWSDNKPYALQLNYLINVKGRKIAKISVEEIENQGFKDKEQLARWKSEMTRIFPDMAAGTSIIGVRTKAGNTVFYKNDKPIGTIKDKEFTKKFFAIWLSPNTSEPVLRQKLLGQK
jgi:hypothetical protein